jgi:hypothetical protein
VTGPVEVLLAVLAESASHGGSKRQLFAEPPDVTGIRLIENFDKSSRLSILSSL